MSLFSVLFLLVSSVIMTSVNQVPGVEAQGYMNMGPGNMNMMNQGMSCSDGSFRDIIPGSYCMYEQDCNNRYSYSTCDWYGMPTGLATSQKMCFCRCGYRWDATTNQCVNNNCWFCSSGVIMAIIIVILVIVIIVAIFTIPTCALVSCMGSKQ